MTESLEIVLITVEQMTVLFVVACVGFLCARRGIIDPSVRQRLTRLLVDIGIPCMLLASVGSTEPGGDVGALALVFGLAVLQGIALYGTGWLCDAIFRVPREDWPVYPFMSLCNNTAFVGIPVVAAIYGSGAVVYVSIYVMVMSLYTFSLGFFTIAPHEPGERFKIPWGAMVNPCLIAAILTLLLFLSPFRLPAVVQDSLSTVGSITSPLAMMIAGAIVSEMPAEEIFSDGRLYGYALVRLLGMPILLSLVLAPIVGDPLQVGIFCVLFGMFTGPMCPTFCLQFGANDRLAARGVVITAILSFACTPAVVIFTTLV